MSNIIKLIHFENLVRVNPPPKNSMSNTNNQEFTVFQPYPDEVEPEARPEYDSETEFETESEIEFEIESEPDCDRANSPPPSGPPLPGRRFVDGKWILLPYNEWTSEDKELADFLTMEESDDEEEVELEWQELLEERWFQLVKNTKPVYGCPIAGRIAKIMQDKQKGKYVDMKMLELINEQNAITSE